MEVATLPAWEPDDELAHAGAVDEWVFAAWAADGSLGIVSGHRLLGGRAWYWSALVRRDRALRHLAEWDVRVRPDPFVVKAPEMWAEHHCVAAFEQWSIGNEAYFADLDDPDEALGRGYGTPVATAMDLEWYATARPVAIELGYAQDGVVHGVVELGGEPALHLHEVPARRWRRWAGRGGLPPIALPAAIAHTGLRAPFAFPDGTVADWVVGRDGWRERRHGTR